MQRSTVSLGMKPWSLLIALAATIWVTGNVVLGAVVAPAAFSVAPPRGTLITREAAGAIFGTVLERWSNMPVTVLLTVVLFSLGMLVGRAWGERRRLVASLLLGVLCLTWACHHLARQTLVEVAALAEERRQTPERSPASEVIFAERHHASERWVGAETLAALLLAVGGVVGVVRMGRASAQRCTV